MCKWDQPQISFTNIISSFFFDCINDYNVSIRWVFGHIPIPKQLFCVNYTYNILVARNPDDIFIDHLEVQMLRISWNPQPNAAEYQ